MHVYLIETSIYIVVTLYLIWSGKKHAERAYKAGRDVGYLLGKRDMVTEIRERLKGRIHDLVEFGVAPEVSLEDDESFLKRLRIKP